MMLPAVKTLQEQEEAVRAAINSAGPATRTRAALQQRLSTILEERTNHLFRMTYYHSLYTCDLCKIKEAEAALAALPSETIELS